MSQASPNWDRVPVILQFPELTKFAESYGFAGSQGSITLEGQLLLPRDRPSTTLFIFMHPSSTLNMLPMPTALANAGLHVLCANGRYPKNDSALIMEKVCYDLGRYVAWARETGGYEKVVLVGWSGGGSLSLFYQGQALNPSITHTPAGDPYDLVAAKLQPADGVIFIAAHLGRAEILTESLDPSVRNEFDPDDRDPELDIYSPDCPNQPPYSEEFVRRFRAAQLERSRRITKWVEDLLDRFGKEGGPEVERPFVVHRTWCDLRWTDPTIDPNARKPGMTVLGEPRATNSAPGGLARFSSLRSWLSQWSIDRVQCKGVDSAKAITSRPVIVVENEADDGVPASHNKIIFDALSTDDKEMHVIKGATHYYVGQPEQLKECIDTIVEWCRRKNLLSA